MRLYRIRCDMKQLKLNSNPYIIKNKNYSTITFSIIFPCNYNRKDMYNLKRRKFYVYD